MPTAQRIAPAAVAFLLAACASSGVVKSPSVAPTASPTSVPGRSPNLAEIVISPSVPPEGMGHDDAIEGRSVLTHVVISGRDSEFRALPGYRDGRLTMFSGESGALLSLALSFETPQDAATAFDLYLDELQSEEGYGFGPGPDANLGDEGTCDEGENPALNGLQESICLWRNGRLVLIAGGPIDPEHLRPYAEAMDQAARDGGSPSASGIWSEGTRDAAVDIATRYAGLTELLGRYPYGVDAVMPGPGGRADVFMWFDDAAVPIEEWPLDPLCEVDVATDPFTGVHAVVNVDTGTVAAVSPRWGLFTCIPVTPP